MNTDERGGGILQELYRHPADKAGRQAHTKPYQDLLRVLDCGEDD